MLPGLIPVCQWWRLEVAPQTWRSTLLLLLLLPRQLCGNTTPSPPPHILHLQVLQGHGDLPGLVLVRVAGLAPCHHSVGVRVQLVSSSQCPHTTRSHSPLGGCEGRQSPSSAMLTTRASARARASLAASTSAMAACRMRQPLYQPAAQATYYAWCTEGVQWREERREVVPHLQR